MGKTDIAAENTSVLSRTAFDAFDAFVSVLTPVAEEEEKSLHDREKTGLSEALPPNRIIHSV